MRDLLAKHHVQYVISVVCAVSMLLAPLCGVALSVGNCSVFRSWNTGDSVNAGDLNSSFTQAAVTNFTWACLDDYSGTIAQMQSATDPYASKTESLATTGAGELERLRYALREALGWTQWYTHTENIDFTKRGSIVDGSGLGRHVTAIGYHSWSGSIRFPAITSVQSHTTGIFWPAAHHMAISVDRAVDADKTGTELVRFHAAGVVFHHTAAIMFRHSTGGMNADQYGHITAISVSRGLVSMAGNEAAHRDTLLFGHAGTVMNLVGYGGSHIALGAQGYIALGRHVGTMTGSNTPVKNALYADLIPKVWVSFNGSTANTPVLRGFGVDGVTDNGTGDYTVVYQTPFLDANNLVVGSGGGTAGTSNTVFGLDAQAAGNTRISTRNDAGSAVDVSVVNVMVLGPQ